MAPKGRSVVKEPRNAVEIAESIKNCRDLVGLADAQIGKALADLGIARVRLAAIEQGLMSQGRREPC
jgi:hypothetical protein